MRSSGRLKVGGRYFARLHTVLAHSTTAAPDHQLRLAEPVSAPIAYVCTARLSNFPIWTLLFLALTGWLGWSVVAAARHGRERSAALTRKVRELPTDLLAPLHDHLLDSALAHYDERELRAGRTRLEFAVLLRDRLDELAGDPHGPLNQAHIRARLLPAAHRLRGYPNPFQVREFRETFLLAADAPTDTLATDIDLEASVQALVFWRDNA